MAVDHGLADAVCRPKKAIREAVLRLLPGLQGEVMIELVALVAISPEFGVDRIGHVVPAFFDFRNDGVAVMATPRERCEKPTLEAEAPGRIARDFVGN